MAGQDEAGHARWHGHGFTRILAKQLPHRSGEEAVNGCWPSPTFAHHLFGRRRGCQVGTGAAPARKRLLHELTERLKGDSRRRARQRSSLIEVSADLQVDGHARKDRE